MTSAQVAFREFKQWYQGHFGREPECSFEQFEAELRAVIPAPCQPLEDASYQDGIEDREGTYR